MCSVGDVGSVSDDVDATRYISGMDSQFKQCSSNQRQETVTDQRTSGSNTCEYYIGEYN